MPNTLLTPDIIARQAYANLYAQTHMAQLVHRDYEPDFNGKVGDTVTVRVPTRFDAREFDRAEGIEIQNAVETGIPVVLDTLLDVSFEVTTEELTLDIYDFNTQFISPATEAIAQGIDQRVLTLRQDVVQATTLTVETPPAPPRPPLSIVRAGKLLNDHSVPASARHGVWDTYATAELISDPLFHEADKRGDTEGLREASIGRKFGVDNWMTQNITDGESVVFHETAFALVVRTLAAPRGAANSAVIGGDGFAIRVVQDYDIHSKLDVISLDVLIGVKTLDPDRAVLVTHENTGS